MIDLHSHLLPSIDNGALDLATDAHNINHRPALLSAGRAAAQ